MLFFNISLFPWKQKKDRKYIKFCFHGNKEITINFVSMETNYKIISLLLLICGGEEFLEQIKITLN